MEVNRLYDRERKMIYMLMMAAVFVILAAVLLIFILGKKSFKDYLLEKDYERLYTYIEEPDFSMKIFNTYMDYNYGGELEIIKTEDQNSYIKYYIKTDTGEKIITLRKRDGKSVWDFNDYVYDWHMTLPKGAVAFIDDMELENKEGEVIIEKLPFAVYQLNIKSKNCDDYSERIMAGQKLTIKMNIAPSAMEICQKTIKEYLRFKVSAVNLEPVDEVSCVEKESGVYKEVIELMEWARGLDYKMSKKLSKLDIADAMVDNDGIICVDAVETWDTVIINENGESITSDKYKNIYFINPEKNFIIIKIKNEQM